LALTTDQIGFALVILLATADLHGIGAVFGDTRAALGLVVGLGLCGTGLAYIFYYLIVDRLGAVAASGATYIPPVVALVIGTLLAGEPVRGLDASATAGNEGTDSVGGTMQSSGRNEESTAPPNRKQLIQ
jgi:drug/metabolite transporter (DMT)-like permease